MNEYNTLKYLFTSSKRIKGDGWTVGTNLKQV